jgi:hypothetical protein
MFTQAGVVGGVVIGELIVAFNRRRLATAARTGRQLHEVEPHRAGALEPVAQQHVVAVDRRWALGERRRDEVRVERPVARECPPALAIRTLKDVTWALHNRILYSEQFWGPRKQFLGARIPRTGIHRRPGSGRRSAITTRTERLPPGSDPTPRAQNEKR